MGHFQMKRTLIPYGRNALMVLLAADLVACGHRPYAAPSPGATFEDLHPTHLQVEEVGPGGSLRLLEVAGSHEQIGYALGEWYRDRGLLPEILTEDQR
jgi:hypothetical protein